jgi:C-terminal processing protease CtpA/Prc
MNVSVVADGVGPSDHSNFFYRRVPALHFFTGTHDDYHKPADTYDKISAEGMEMILDYAYDLIVAFSKMDTLGFNPSAKGSTAMRSPTMKVTLGVVPNYAYQQKGMKIDGVSEGKPAQKAGLQAGDIVLGLNECEVRDMMGYMNCLSVFKPGQSIEVKLLRNTEELVLPLTFDP